MFLVFCFLSIFKYLKILSFITSNSLQYFLLFKILFTRIWRVFSYETIVIKITFDKLLPWYKNNVNLSKRRKLLKLWIR